MEGQIAQWPREKIQKDKQRDRFLTAMYIMYCKFLREDCPIPKCLYQSKLNMLNSMIKAMKMQSNT
jgi:hypothetical protein